MHPIHHCSTLGQPDPLDRVDQATPHLENQLVPQAPRDPRDRVVQEEKGHQLGQADRRHPLDRLGPEGREDLQQDLLHRWRPWRPSLPSYQSYQRDR